MADKIYSLDNDYPQSSIEEISQLNQQKMEEVYRQLFTNPENHEKIQKIVKETREMIPQIDERIHYWESRRTQFLQISVGILAAALAGIVAVAPDVFERIDENQFFSFPTAIYMPLLILSILLIVGSTKILILWNKQNNPPYPFTKGTKTWRWQYRHAETKATNTDFLKFNRTRMEEEAFIFANNMIDYKIKTLTSDEQELLDQDLSQLYLLLINEKFKIKFVSQLRDMLISSLRNAAIAAIITIGLMVFGSLVKSGVAMIQGIIFFLVKID